MFRWRHLGLWFSSLIPLALVCAVVPTALLAKDKQTDVFREIAHEIIKGIDQTGRPVEPTGKLDHALRYFQRAYYQSIGEKLRVAIWPYDEDELPIQALNILERPRYRSGLGSRQCFFFK